MFGDALLKYEWLLENVYNFNVLRIVGLCGRLLGRIFYALSFWSHVLGSLLLLVEV